MISAGARIQPEDPQRPRRAVGYMDAMHGLCVDCHRERAEELGKPRHGDCATCHREIVAASAAGQQGAQGEEGLAVGSYG